MAKKYYLLFLSLALITTGCAAASGPLGIGILSAVIISLAVFSSACENDSDSKPYPRIFVTAKTSDGHLGDEGGLTGADNMCNDTDDSNHPGGSKIFKALIASTDRAPGTDWVLKASTEYKRHDGTVIGTTDAGAVFTTPLSNGISDTVTYAWTGLDDDFTLSSYHLHCGNWTSGSYPYSGIVGKADQTTSDAWDDYYSYCNNTHSIICVEQ